MEFTKEGQLDYLTGCVSHCDGTNIWASIFSDFRKHGVEDLLISSIGTTVDAQIDFKETIRYFSKGRSTKLYQSSNS
jgi:hypothetical protein